MIDTDKYEGHTCEYCDEVIEMGAIVMNNGTLYHDYCFEALVHRGIRTEEDILHHLFLSKEVIE